MISAALDLGTNTFLCLIVEGDASGLRRVIADEAEVVRLGQDVDRTGRFHDEALARAKATLTRFRALIDQHHVERIRAVATSAARDVANGGELFAIAHALNIPLECISGEEEARLSFAGATAEVSDNQARLVVDIGGGSTELIVGRGKQALFARSLDIGAVRLTERLITAQPVPAAEREELARVVASALNDVLPELRKYRFAEILAVAGTPTALATIELGGFDAAKIEGHTISLEKLERWQGDFAGTTVEEKKRRYNLGGRADIIYAGVTILRSLIESLQAPDFKVSVKGLRYGVALDLNARGERAGDDDEDAQTRRPKS